MQAAGMMKQALWHAYLADDVLNQGDSQAKLSRAVYRDLWSSAGWVALMVLFGIGLLFASGKVHPSFPLDVGKCCSIAGAWLAGWGTWLGIQGRQASWGSKRPDEVARDGLFRILFIPGVLLSVIGGGWWG